MLVRIFRTPPMHPLLRYIKICAKIPNTLFHLLFNSHLSIQNMNRQFLFLFFFTRTLYCGWQKGGQTWSVRGEKLSVQVTVGESAEGSFTLTGQQKLIFCQNMAVFISASAQRKWKFHYWVEVKTVPGSQSDRPIKPYCHLYQSRFWKHIWELQSIRPIKNVMVILSNQGLKNVKITLSLTIINSGLLHRLQFWIFSHLKLSNESINA